MLENVICDQVLMNNGGDDAGRETGGCFWDYAEANERMRFWIASYSNVWLRFLLLF